MPETKRPLKVFLCHASADKSKVHELYQRLKMEGWIDPWLDVAKILPGQHWTSVIRQSLAEADSVIILISNSSINREGFVQREMNYAWDLSLEKPRGVIYLIPLRLEECDVPYDLRERQWADYFGEKQEETYRALLQSLNLRHEQKLMLEEQERVQKEKVGREIGEKIARERAEREKIEREFAERARQEKEDREVFAKSLELFSPPRHKLSLKQLIARIGAVFLGVAAILTLVLSLRQPANRTPESTLTSSTNLTANAPVTNLPSDIVNTSLTPTEVFVSREFVTPSLTPTETITPTATPLPLEITDSKGVSMHLVSAGEFTMGFSADEANSFCQTLQSKIPYYGFCYRDDYLREEPEHKVYLNNFFMDVYEVSNGDYENCVAERVCAQPSKNSANRYSSYYGNPNFRTYPVLYVTWDMAKTYCEWRGARLPTEAEWEKAARGIYGYIYPWGNYNSAYRLYDRNFYTNKANLKLDAYNQATVFVDSNPEGLSPYGLYNMGGNVAEWVADWYSETYYGEAPVENPPGPSSGEYKVIRGGSVDTSDIRTTVRNYLKPSESNRSTGFRCANDTNP